MQGCVKKMNNRRKERYIWTPILAEIGKLKFCHFWQLINCHFWQFYEAAISGDFT